MSEFEKRATSIHIEFGKLKGGERTTKRNLVRMEDIDEARKDLSTFPDPRSGKYWKGMIGNSMFLYSKYRWDFELWKQGFEKWFLETTL